MRSDVHWRPRHRFALLAALLACCLAAVFPSVASAHAILLRSDPAADSVLRQAPAQVRMWFSEDVNPDLTTAVILGAASQRVDNNEAHISPSDPREMDVTLRPDLQPSVYVVLYRTHSADDGHILRGSFIFSVARPDGSVPSLAAGATAGEDLLGGSSVGQHAGQLDGTALFILLVTTLVELGTVFWGGAAFWVLFVLRRSTEAHPEQQSTNQQAQRRFERRFAGPTLLMLLLANGGIVVGQALNATGGTWTFSLTLLFGLATSGRFGTWWIAREAIIGLALLLALSTCLLNQMPRPVKQARPWLHLILSLALFLAIAMSSHASAVSSNLLAYAVVVDWLHLLAAALWVGGMLYLSTTYLPVIQGAPSAERTRSLLTTLPYYSLLAVVGVVLIAITGPLSATFRLTSWDQLLATAYGRTLSVKLLLVGALLATSAYHVGLLRPRLRKELKKYTHVAKRLAAAQTREAKGVPNHARQSLGQQVNLREGRLTRKTQRLITVLRWEPVLGVGVLLCVGLLNVFGGTLAPAGAGQQPNASSGNGAGKPFHQTVMTSDKQFAVTFDINPNRFGTNQFTVTVVDARTGKVAADVGVSLYSTLLDMDTGTASVNLLPDGKGHFSGRGDLSMGGRWQVRIQVRTPDATLHEAIVSFFTPD